MLKFHMFQVHRCYGEELGFNSDDEGYSRDLAGDAPALAVDTTSEVSQTIKKNILFYLL